MLHVGRHLTQNALEITSTIKLTRSTYLYPKLKKMNTNSNASIQTRPDNLVHLLS